MENDDNVIQRMKLCNARNARAFRIISFTWQMRQLFKCFLEVAPTAPERNDSRWDACQHL